MPQVVNWKKAIYLLTEGPVIHLGLAIFALRNVISNPLILGRKFDWSLPLFDLKPLLAHSLSSWNTESAGAPVGYYSAWLGDFIYGLFGFLGIKPTILIPLFLVICLTLAGWGMTRLARSIHNPWQFALLSGLFYMLTPTIYIRIIIGFTFWILAYALAPWILLLYLKVIHRKNWLAYALWTGVLLALASAQIQFAIMISFILIVTCLTKGYGLVFSKRVVRLGLIFFVAILLHLPWLLALLARDFSQDVSFLAAGSAVLKSVIDLPHSFRRTLFLNEHHITAGFFDQKNFQAFNFGTNYALIIILFFGLIFFWKKINLRWIILFSLILGFTITILPHQHLVWLYTQIFNISKLTNLFREVYHAQFLMAFSYALAIASIGGAFWRLNIKPVIKLLTFGLLAVLILVFDQAMISGSFSNFGSNSELSPQYQRYYQNTSSEDKLKTRVWFPLGLGFVQAKGDDFGASNGDVIARSLGFSTVDSGSSVLNLPNKIIDVRNTMIHQLQQGQPIDQFLNKLNVDLVIDRQDYQSLNVALTYEVNPNKELLKYWQQPNLSQSIHSYLWSKDDNFNPLVVYQKKIVLAKIRPAKNLSLSFGNYKDLSSKNDILFLAQQPNKEEVIDLWPVFNPNSEQDQLASLADDKYKTSLIDRADKNYKASQGWSQGRFSWWREEDLAASIESFVYTTTPDRISKNISLTSFGFHYVLIRLWYSPGGGLISLGIGDKSIQVNTKAEEGQWRWLTLSDVIISAAHKEVIAESITGEQGVGAVVFLPFHEYEILMEQMKEIKTETRPAEAKTQVVANLVNSTKYRVKIKNPEPFMLIFSENYDPNWRLKINKKIYEPTIVNGWANGFWIDKSLSNQTGVIYYTPQIWYNFGLIIAFLTLLSIVVYNLWQIIRKII